MKERSETDLYFGMIIRRTHIVPNGCCVRFSLILDSYPSHSMNTVPLEYITDEFTNRPLTIIVTGTIGTIVTSCAQQILGTTIWEPFELLGAIMDF